MEILKVYHHAKLLKEIELDQSKEYLFGRSKDSEVQLKDSKFSRQHFKLIYKGQCWVIELLSKYSFLETEDGQTNYLELTHDMNFSTPPYNFDFFIREEEIEPEFEFQEEEKNENEYELSEESSEEPEVQIEEEALVEMDSPAEDEFDENEATSVGQIQRLPYVRILLKDRSEELLKLEGTAWIAGRGEKSELFLKDEKASRQHFQIVKDADDYLLKDLGSSNGTFLNGRKVNPSKIAPLQSGDVIQVGSTLIYFELRDPNYESRWGNIDQFKAPVLRANSAMDPFYQQDPMNPLAHRARGQVGNPSAVRLYQPEPKKKKSNKAVIYFAIILLGGAAYYKSQKKEAPKEEKMVASKEKEKEKTPFEMLNPREQNIVQNSMNNARNFYLGGDYELALKEVDRIHRVLPEYKDPIQQVSSKEIEMRSKQALDINRQRQAIEKKQAEQEALKRRINQIAEECDRRAVPGTTKAQADQCLAELVRLDPENPVFQRIYARIEAEQQRKLATANARRAQQAQVARGVALYNTAKSIDQKGNILDSIDAYRRHANSSFPDPDNLRAKSNARIKELQSELASKTSDLLSKAKSSYESKQYKDAQKSLDKLLALDPSVQEAKNLYNKMVDELRIEMKKIYTESILEEDRGEIKPAISIWKKIIETDLPSGDYYKKAQSKLKKYTGAQ